MNWTESAVAELRQMVAAKMTAAKIGAHFGITRNAVIGKAHRMKLRLLGGNGFIKSVSGKSRPHRPRRAAQQANKPMVSPTFVADTVEPVLDMTGYHTVGRPLMALSTNQCHYAVNDAPRGGEHLFCAAPATRSWCDNHRRIVYRPPPVPPSRRAA